MRDVYEQAVGKMLKIFPLADEILALVPAADPRQKGKFTATQIRKLAKRLLPGMCSDQLDGVYTEWNCFLLEEDEAHREIDLVAYWNLPTYPNLCVLMRTVMCIPHSNAQCERVFSMLKKIHTDHRSDLCKDSINALMAIKMNTDTCCYDADLTAPVLKKLKSAARSYNDKHS